MKHGWTGKRGKAEPHHSLANLKAGPPGPQPGAHTSSDTRWSMSSMGHQIALRTSKNVGNTYEKNNNLLMKSCEWLVYVAAVESFP